MKYLIVLASFFIAATCLGQTKLIAHRSHSGSNANFRVALAHGLFDIGDSNFGAITQVVKAIDSVILKPDGSIVVLKKKYAIAASNAGKPYDKIYTRDTIAKKDRHAFLKAKNVEGLKAQVKKVYPAFKTDSVQFIGFDKQLSRRKPTSEK